MPATNSGYRATRLLEPASSPLRWRTDGWPDPHAFAGVGVATLGARLQALCLAAAAQIPRVETTPLAGLNVLPLGPRPYRLLPGYWPERQVRQRPTA